MTTATLTIRQPDDWHVHLRDGEMLHRVLPFTSKVFRRALVMPNLTPPVLEAKDARAYMRRIQDVQAQGAGLRSLWEFSPYMTIKLTGMTTPKIVEEAKAAGVIAAKLYPAGVTTNSSDGVNDFEAKSLYEVFEAMAQCGMVLCVHAETPGQPSLRREQHFIDTYVEKWASAVPRLKIVIEHATTKHAVEFARRTPNVGCSITVHHMLITLDDVIGDKLDPHCFCKPVAKSEEDRQALIEAATGGVPDIFFGSDSAPHTQGNKREKGAAGCFTAPVAMPLLAQIFDEHGALANLETFVSENGANFYGLPLNESRIRLTKNVPWKVEDFYASDRLDEGEFLTPFWAGKHIDWYVDDVVPETTTVYRVEDLAKIARPAQSQTVRVEATGSTFIYTGKGEINGWSEVVPL